MTLRKILLSALIISSLAFTGCLKEDNTKKDTAQGVILKRTNSQVSIIAASPMAGCELTVSKGLKKEDIHAGKDNLLILSAKDNSATAAIVKIGGEIKSGDEIAVINSSEALTISLKESIKTGSLNSAFKKKGTTTDILLGDFNGNDQVDLLDFKIFEAQYGKISTDSDFNPICDISTASKGTTPGWEAIFSSNIPDNKISLADFAIFGSNYGFKKPQQSVTATAITLSGNSSVDIGKTLTLSAIVKYSDNSEQTETLIWASSNNSVASVLNGVVTGLKEGTATITVSKQGTSLSQKKDITVNPIAVFNGIKIHVKGYTHIWAWDATKNYTGGVWPGVAMTAEGNGWYLWSIDNLAALNIIFSNAGSSQTAELSRVKGEWWYDTTWHDTNPNDTIPPVVALLSPANNASLTGKVTVSASASDNGGISKVLFYAGDKNIGSALSEPYSLQWDTAYTANGSCIVKAVAFDKAGNSTTSSSVTVTLTNANVPPIANAGADITVLAGSTVNFDASASYDNGKIVSYEWDNGLSGVKVSKSYPTIGVYTVTLTVTDDGGLKTTDTVTVNVVADIPHRDFREETVYFMMTDRFSDGNTNNNNIWGDEFLPSGKSAYDYDEDKTGVLSYYHGGDFEGIIKNLDYLKDMGFTAIWITPVVKQPEGRRFNAGGTYQASAFHGYWGYDFDKIDPHLTSSGKDNDGWADFDKLVAALHAKGMKLMLDIVVNHGHPGDSVKGSTSKWADKWNKVIMDGKEWTFDKTVDPLVDPADPKTGFYSYAGTGGTWLIDLLDFNGNGPSSNNAMPHLKNVYKRFIDHGVDAFRIDTVAYMSHDNWVDFTDEMANYAKSKGNDHFYMIGEAWTGAREGLNNAVDIIYGKKGTNFHMLDLHNSSMDFPGWLGNVFKGAAGFDDGNVNKIFGPLGDLSGIYDPTYLGTFVDNHDVFRANGILTESQYKNNLNYIYLFRGVPIVYYGTEAMYSWPGAKATTNKEDVCARWMLGDQGIDYVKTNKPPMYKHLKMLNALRRSSEVLRKGQQTNLVMKGDQAVIKRVYNTTTIYAAMTKGAAYTYQLTGIEDGTYKKYIPDSANGTFTTQTITVSGGSYTLDVPANSFVAIEK